VPTMHHSIGYRITALACVFALRVSLVAQLPIADAPVSSSIDEAHRVTLQGNTYPLARAQYDRGPVSPDLSMGDLVLVLRRSPELQGTFDAFVASQYDSASPNYHQWLEPEEVGEKFGPAPNDIATISNWLRGHGFSIDEVSKDHMSIRFSGTASQVESTFHTNIHNIEVKGKKYIGNLADPQIPSAFLPVVVGVKALHNFFPRPVHRLGSQVVFDYNTKNWERITSAQVPNVKLGGTAWRASVHAQFGTTDSYGDVLEDVTPYDFATIYNVLPLWTANTPIDGTGQTVAIAGTSNINLADIAAFRKAFGLPAMIPTVIVTNTDPGNCSNAASNCIDDLIENSLDVEWSGAVAKGASILLITSNATTPTTDSLFLSENYIVQNKTAQIMSVSYGECELDLGTAGNAEYNTLWQTAATEGIAVFVAAGDSGGAACDDGLDTTVPYAARYGLSVNGIASTAYNTAVGGTDFNWGDTSSPYWSKTNNSTTLASAFGYIPETPWNDTCANPLAVIYLENLASYVGVSGVVDAESACNFVINYGLYVYEITGGAYDPSGFVDITAGSGGVSACTTSDGTTIASCTGSYSKPNWQASITGIPADGKRDIPDISFFASDGFLGSSYLICVSANGACTYSDSAEPTAQEVGGTSVATATMAGTMALINQKAGAPQGSPNIELYTLAGLQTYSSCSTQSDTTSSTCYFNDINSGTNAVPCQSGMPNCTAHNAGDLVGLLPGYSSGLGYDLATGLGSLNVENVVNAWPTASNPLAATVTVTPGQTTLSSNSSLNLTTNVTGASVTPTGTVTLLGGDYTSPAETLSNGSYTFTIPANSLNTGTNILTVTYSGNSTYTTATGTTTVTVESARESRLTPTITVTPAGSSLGTGESLSVTSTVASTSVTPTGTVSLSGGDYTSPMQSLSNGSYTFNIPANSLNSGTDILTVIYSGDTNFTSATATASVTVTESTFILAATTTPAVAPGSSATSTVTVNGVSGYTGTITLACALSSYPSGAMDLPTCSVGNSTLTLNSNPSAGKATVTVNTTAVTTALVVPKLSKGSEWTRICNSDAVPAFLMCLGIPTLRRRWRSMLGILIVISMLSSLAGCSIGRIIPGNNTTNRSNPGTSAGAYTFTVTGTGTPLVSPTPTTTFILSVE